MKTVFILFSFFAVSASALVAPKSTVLYTDPSNEKPVEWKEVQCGASGGDLTVEAGRLGKGTSLSLTIKNYETLDLKKAFVLQKSEWGELNFWDVFDLQWSVNGESPQSYCVLSFSNVKRDAEKIQGLDLAISCQGLTAPRLTPTRSIRILKKNPIRCNFRS